MAVEPGHMQITEFSKEAIPQLNWMLEDLFCRYGTNIPYFCLDYAFPDYSERPDWVSGYNFNLDWGEWGYWLVWFNNLLGLLFDTANLPRWQMPDLSPASWAMFNDYMSELYDESAPKVFLDALYSNTTYQLRSHTRKGAALTNWSATEHIDQGNTMCVDEDDNVYYIDNHAGARDIIRKYDRDGNLLLSKTTNYSERLCTGSDGYIYEQGTDDSNNYVIAKRNRTDLTVDSTMALDSSFGGGFACDSDGYLYTWRGLNLEKWDFDSAIVVASRAITGGADHLAIVGDTIMAMQNRDEGFTIPTSLDEDQTDFTLGNDHAGVTAVDNEYFVVSEYDSPNELLVKYDTSRNKLWEVIVGTMGFSTGDVYVYDIAAYPF